MTLAEAQAELASVKASIAVQTGAAGASSYTVQGTQIMRAPISVLYRRQTELEALIKRLDPTEGGAIRYPLFGTRS